MFGQNMSERVLVSDPVEMILGPRDFQSHSAGSQVLAGVCLL